MLPVRSAEEVGEPVLGCVFRSWLVILDKVGGGDTAT
jgi:hypothetical protein